MAIRPTEVPVNPEGVLPPLERFAADLIAAYPTEQWWPAETSFEVMAGAVLVQNTRWSNVEHALARMRAADCLSAEAVSSCSPDRLRVLIKPAGCQSVKARRLGNLAQWLVDFGGHRQIAKTRTDELRARLLDINGVGPETADAILSIRNSSSDAGSLGVWPCASAAGPARRDRPALPADLQNSAAVFALPVSASLSPPLRWLGFDWRLLAVEAVSGNPATVGSNQV